MNCTIYGLYDPITKELRYIGQTTRALERRLYDHYMNSRKNNRYISKWIRKMLKLYGKVDIKTLEENCEWNIDEKIWIQQMKLCGVNLTNQTNGGDSPDQFKKRHLTKEAKRKISVYQKGRPKSEKFRKYISKIQEKAVICLNNNQEYESASKAAIALNLDFSAICKICHGKRKIHKGYVFEWKDKKNSKTRPSLIKS